MSLITFAIGTVVNILVAYAVPNPTIVALAFVFEVVILVQLFEAVGWHNLKEGQNSTGAANGLVIAVMIQPIVLALALLSVSEASPSAKYVAATIAFIYAGWCLYVLSRASPPHVNETCSHLDYYWWDDFPGNSWPYLIALFAIGLLLIRPFDLGIFVAIYLAVTLGLSALFYRRNIGSIWCWFGAFGMAFIALYWYLRELYINQPSLE